MNCSDPSGHVLVTERNADIIDALKSLTGYNILIDEEGIVTLGNAINTDYRASVMLVRALIEDPHVTTLRYTYDTERRNRAEYENQDNAKNGIGSNAAVYLNPALSEPVPTLINGRIVDSGRPFYITLGHELIHALAIVRGYLDETAVYSYEDMLGNIVNTSDYPRGFGRAEEFYTVGFPGYIAGHRMVNENMLRAEHGLNLRGRYERRL